MNLGHSEPLLPILWKVIPVTNQRLGKTSAVLIATDIFLMVSIKTSVSSITTASCFSGITLTNELAPHRRETYRHLLLFYLNSFNSIIRFFYAFVIAHRDLSNVSLKLGQASVHCRYLPVLRSSAFVPPRRFQDRSGPWQTSFPNT